MKHQFFEIDSPKKCKQIIRNPQNSEFLQKDHLHSGIVTRVHCFRQPICFVFLQLSVVQLKIGIMCVELLLMSKNLDQFL